MVGYQEIVSDPSYTDQAVVMTYPLIGNYGITDDDYECKTPSIGALIVGDYNDMPSNFRYTKTVGEVLEEMKARDWADSHRAAAPLQAAADAVTVDTTHMDFQQSMDAILQEIRKRVR